MLSSLLRSSLLAVLLPVAAAQTTWLVPGDVPTIQGAVDLAASGDTILVSPGVYHERLNLNYKDLVVRSTRGARSTIVDAEGKGRVLVRRFPSSTATTIFQGFTLRGGYSPEGGGAHLAETFELRDCIVRDNYSTDYGGGIYANWNFVTIVNTVVVDNLAAKGQGGIYCFGFSLARIVNCTVVGNEVEAPGDTGAGLRAYNPQVILQNTIVRENRSAGVISSVHPTPGLQAEHCDFEGAASFPGFGNVDLDPQFVDLAGRDLHLRPSSPVIDAGTDPSVAISVDYEGDSRGGGDPYDIGADELRARMYFFGEARPGQVVDVRAVGYAAGTTLSAWLSPQDLDPPLSTAYGDWWLADRCIVLLDGEVVPAGGVVRAPYLIPGTLPAPLPLYAQVLGAGTLSPLETVLVE